MKSSDEDDIRRYVERFALLLTDAGMARTPARVFACVLVSGDGRLTARELAERLQLSPAAISGAVRYLAQTGLLVREREPGARSDHYAVHDDVWTDMYTSRMAIMRRWADVAEAGVELLGADSPAGRRLAETREFFAFVQTEIPGLVGRWQAHKAARGL